MSSRATANLPAAKRAGGVRWPGQDRVAFSDALTAVRRWLWAEAVFPQAEAGAALAQLPASVRELLLADLAPAPRSAQVGVQGPA